MINFILGFLVCFVLFIIIGIILLYKYFKLPSIVRSMMSLSRLDKTNNDDDNWLI